MICETMRGFSFRFGCLSAVLSVTVLLLIQTLLQSKVYQDWINCEGLSYRSPVASTTRILDELNASGLKKRTPTSPKQMQELFDNVETFVMFIGYPRSGHSLIGSLLDAHPEIIIPHQFNLVKKWTEVLGSKNGSPKMIVKYKLFTELYSKSESQALFDLRAPKTGLTYCYHVPGAWQGTYKTRVQVIGNKQGATTSLQSPSVVFKLLEQLEKVTEMPLKLIHVVRNPFDNIATMALRELHARDAVRNSSTQINDREVLDSVISIYFKMASTNKEVLQRRGNIILNLKSHETILRPRETIQKLCDHVQVTCYPEYVEACVNMLYKSITVTRNKVIWTNDQKERVLNEMKKYSFLKHFNFEDVP